MEVQRAKDPNNLTESEQKHIPIIEIDDEVSKGETTTLVVRVGAVTHPMEPNHYIEWIKLFNGEQLIDQVSFHPKQEPKGKFNIVLNDSAKLKALESCTVHGLWEQTKRVGIK